MSTNFIVQIVLVLVAMAGSTTAVTATIGRAYEPGSKNLLYIERYREKSSSRTLVEYFDSDGELLVEKHLDYSRSATAPDVKSTDHRLQSRLTISSDNDRINIETTRKGDSTTNATVAMQEHLVIDAGFDHFIRDNWESLVNRSTRTLHFLVPAREAAYELKIKRRACPGDDASRVCFQIKAANWLLGAFMQPINVEYEESARRLIRFVGVGHLSDAKGKGLKADIRYEYSEP